MGFVVGSSLHWDPGVCRALPHRRQVPLLQRELAPQHRTGRLSLSSHSGMCTLLRHLNHSAVVILLLKATFGKSQNRVS